MLDIPLTIATTLSAHRLRFMKTEEWYPKTYQGWSGLLFIQGIAAIRFLLALFPWAMRMGMYHARGDDFHWFWNVHEQQRARRIFLSHIKKNPRFAKLVVREFLRVWQRLDTVSRAALAMDFRHASLRVIGQWYERCVAAAIAQASYGYLADCLLTAGEEDWLMTEFSRAFRGRVPKDREVIAIAILTAPTIPTFIQEEAYARARLAALWQKGRRGKTFEAALARHCERFATVQGNYASVPLHTVAAVRRSLASIDVRSLMRQQHVFQKNARAKERLLRTYQLSSLRPLLRATALFTHMQDYRKWAVTKVNAVIFRVVDALEQRLAISRETLLYATPNDIIAACEGKRVDWKRIALWRKGVFFWFTKSGVEVYVGTALSKFNLSFLSGSQKRLREVRGTSAMAGNAQGRVRLVFGRREIAAFRRGEILVTNNTTPEFLPAMKKAAAIVTEQGGITTHAAIIAREFKIPCIIGTKIATQVFKNGDRVEVDAEAGVVRKIS